MSNILKIKKKINSVIKYEAGLSKIANKKKGIIKLSSNEGALGSSDKAQLILKKINNEVSRYPDPELNRLRKVISNKYKINSNNIIFGNGSDEILSIIARIFSGPGDEVLFSEHGFLMYPIAAQLAGAKGIKVKDKNYKNCLENFLKKVNKKTKIIFIANPNNPTGTYLNTKELDAFCKKLPKRILLVLDGAYAEYVNKKDYDPGNNLVKKNNNVLMTRTFSKIYGLAGLRLGWCFCSKEIAKIYNKVRLPFNVNSAASEAAIASINDKKFTSKCLKHNELYLNWLTKEIINIGLTPIESVANFVLVKFPKKGRFTSKKVYKFLLSKGIILRTVNNYGLRDFLRISIGKKPELFKLVKFLKIYFKIK